MSLSGLLGILILVALFLAFRRWQRGRKSNTWQAHTATITASRVGENDMGSVTQCYPLIDVTFEADGQHRQLQALAVARETHTNRARVEALLAKDYKAGASVAISVDPAQPQRAKLA